MRVTSFNIIEAFVISLALAIRATDIAPQIIVEAVLVLQYDADVATSLNL